MPLDRARVEVIAKELEDAGGGIPHTVPTPKGARQFIFPNGMVLRFDLAPTQYSRRNSLGTEPAPISTSATVVAGKNDVMTYDFNALERRGQDLIEAGRPRDAISIYLFMADGDPSLDGGYLGKRLAECYEAIGDLHAAKYWYGRAVEENPAVRRDCAAARQRLAAITIDDLLEHPSRAAE
jgi:tetratricopeptide (TPR) repeat protein